LLTRPFQRRWLEAAKDLEIRAAAPFAVQVSEDEPLTYEAHVLDCGELKGSVVGVLVQLAQGAPITALAEGRHLP
jgi:hypothetical protein